MGKKKLKKQIKKKNELEKLAKLKVEKNACFSFKNLADKQIEKISELSPKLLKEIFSKLKHYSNMKTSEVFNKNFKEYGLWEEIPKNEFERPEYIEEEALWSSMHIKSKECLIFHREDNVFNLVFIDTEHKFYPSKKKHT